MAFHKAATNRALLSGMEMAHGNRACLAVRAARQIAFDRTEATDLLKTNDDARDRSQYEPISERVSQQAGFRDSGLGIRRMKIGVRGFVRRTPNSVFDRTEATDLLKTKDGARGPNPIRTHFQKGFSHQAGFGIRGSGFAEERLRSGGVVANPELA